MAESLRSFGDRLSTVEALVYGSRKHDFPPFSQANPPSNSEGAGSSLSDRLDAVHRQLSDFEKLLEGRVPLPARLVIPSGAEAPTVQPLEPLQSL